MRVLILGAGGVGGYLGYRLARLGGAQVSLVARGTHLEAIREHGLRVIDDGEEATIRPEHAIADPSGLGAFDLILVTVKHTDLASSLELIRENITPNTLILPLLNGVEHRREILEVYPDADVMEGCIYILSNIVEPGTIRKKGAIFNLCWGREDFDPTDYPRITALFNRALPRHKPTADIAPEQWRKYLFISPMAALTSLYDKTMDRIVAEHSEELKGLMNEITALARAKGIPLNDETVEETFERMGKTLPGAKTSMQLDLERGKPAEIEALVGYVVKDGKRMGVDVSGMERVYRELKIRSTTIDK
jgi:2-dehydropantoate 2-reductase